MRNVYNLLLVSVVAMAMLSGCAPKSSAPKVAPAPIALTKPDVGTQRACFVSGESLTCLSRTLLPNGGKRMTVETTPLIKPE